jgi:ketosteroid isomerase-like protein
MSAVQAVEDEIRHVSDGFYTALNELIKGNSSAMRAVWMQDATVTTMHPLGGMESGWDQVWSTWEQAASAFSVGQIRLLNQQIRAGADLAYEVGTEDGEATFAGQQIAFNHRVTNIYRRSNGEWKIAHHHADLSPEMVEIVRSTS